MNKNLRALLLVVLMSSLFGQWMVAEDPPSPTKWTVPLPSPWPSPSGRNRNPKLRPLAVNGIMLGMQLTGTAANQSDLTIDDANVVISARGSVLTENGKVLAREGDSDAKIRKLFGRETSGENHSDGLGPDDDAAGYTLTYAITPDQSLDFAFYFPDRKIRPGNQVRKTPGKLSLIWLSRVPLY